MATFSTSNSREMVNVKRIKRKRRMALCSSSSCPEFCSGNCSSTAYDSLPEKYQVAEDYVQACNEICNETEEKPVLENGEKQEGTPPKTSNLWNFHRRILPNRKIRSDMDPRYLHRFYQLDCSKCGKTWTSPLTKAEVGLFCPDCSTFIRPTSWKDYATPYIGPHLCFGQFRCHRCACTWNSQRSVSHSGQVCYFCGTLNFPLRQMPILQKLEQWRRNAERLEAFKMSQPCHPEVKDDESVIYPPDEKLAPPSFRAKWNIKKLKGLQVPEV